MTTLPANAGSKFFIGGPAPEIRRAADITREAFDGQTWLEVEGLEDLDQLRATADPARHAPSLFPVNFATRAKAARWVDTYSPKFSMQAGAPGQAAVYAAETGTDDFAFRIVLNDAPFGGTPSERIFFAAVAGIAEIFGGPESAPKLGLELWVNSNIVRVDAAPAEE